MSEKKTLSDAIQASLKQIPTVIADLQERPDYGDTQKEAVQNLNTLKTLLLEYTATPAPTAKLTEQVLSETQGTVLPMLSDIISANVDITKMQPLSLKRTITPTMAKAHNVDMKALETELQMVVAGSSTSGGEEPIDPEQAELELLTEVASYKATSDPEADAEVEQLSGIAGPC